MDKPTKYRELLKLVRKYEIYEDEKRATETAERKTSSDATRKATRKIKAGLEKTTLGDISELAALKTEMENRESKRKKAKEEKTEKPEKSEKPEKPEKSDN